MSGLVKFYFAGLCLVAYKPSATTTAELSAAAAAEATGATGYVLVDHDRLCHRLSGNLATETQREDGRSRLNREAEAAAKGLGAVRAADGNACVVGGGGVLAYARLSVTN